MQQQQPQQQQQPPPQQTMIPTAATYPAMMPATSAPTFRRIKVRHTMFKVGVAGLFLSTILFIVGFAVPAWVNKSGLWLSCGGWGGCDDNAGSGPAWFDAVRAMETLALVCFLFCVAVELYQDVFKSPPPPENKAVEILAGLAAMFGLIGIIIFGVKTKRSYSSYNYNYGYVYYHSNYLQWGFGLATAGCILVLICCILIAYSRVYHAAQTKQAMALYGIVVPESRPSAPAMMPMQPMQPMMMPMQPMMQPMQPMMQPMQPAMQMPPSGYYPYPYPYPVPAVTPLTAPPATVPAPVAATPTPQAAPAATSQVPAFYVMKQGQMVPVYNEMPSTAAAAAVQQNAIPNGTAPEVDGQPDGTIVNKL